MASDNFRVGVYTDAKTLLIRGDGPLRAENICKECAKILQIDFTCIPLFGLFHLHKRIWLSPNHLLNPSDLEKDVDYIFRIRFHPENTIRSGNFMHYLQLQYRECLRKEFQVSALSTSVLFGWSIWDMMTDSYTRKLTHRNNVFQGKRYKNFFPEQALIKYSMLQKMFLKRNLKLKLLQFHEEYKNCKIDTLRDAYINWIKKEFHTQLTTETYLYKDKNGNKKMVTIQERDGKFVVCFESETYLLKNVRSVTIRNNFVEIFVKEKSPKMLQMEPEIAESFVSAMDGLYRLAYDYHYGICDYVLSPRIKHLQTLGCYDYIEDQTVRGILETKTQHSGSFLMRMRLEDTETFDVLFVDSDTSRVEKFTVGPNEEFKSLESLQENKPFLLHKIVPTHFEWCNLLFCYKPVSPVESSVPPSDTNNLVYSGISFLEERSFHRGIFTESYKARDKASQTNVDMKTLRYSPDCHVYMQLFMKDVYNVLKMVNCSCFLQVKGVVLAPTFGMITESTFNSVILYLSDKNLPLVYILKMALTVAEGLEFLRNEGIVHGDITCENLQLVNVNTVKITDASIVNKVYLLPKTNKIYKSRIAWLDPQIRNGQSPPTFESDIFSYGTMLCEMFCFQCKPPVEYQHKQIEYEAPCRLLLNVDDNEECARMADTVRKQLHELVIKCRSYKMEDRPQPLDISTKLHELVHKTIIQKELATRIPDHSMCDHNWRHPIIDQENIFEAMKIITKKLCNLKALKPTCEYEIEEKYLKTVNRIGQGACGQVYLATYTPLIGDQQMVAVKKLSISLQSSISSEIKILKQLDHERIIKFLGNCPVLGIVMEYVKGGDLISRLKKSQNCLIPNLKMILYEITEGMEYLQQMKIIHRDLAARNVLLTEYDHVKITDFGLSKDYEGDYYMTHTRRSLPLLWSPPEMKKISSKSDVWSFGVLMWECYSCGSVPNYNKPFKNFEDYINHVTAGKRLPRPALCPKTMYKKMQDCWNLELSKRPDFRDLKITFFNA